MPGLAHGDVNRAVLLDVVGGNWAANAAAMSLTVLAIASLVAGLWALLGELGLILAVLTIVLIGNPVLGRWFGSRAAARTVGAIGKLMPPGAGGNLLRSTGFFDCVAAGGHAAVLVAWTLAGWPSYSPREQGTDVSRQSGPRSGLASAGMDGAW